MLIKYNFGAHLGLEFWYLHSHVLYTYDQGRGTQGDWGSDFPRIRDLYSKSFENSQIQSYF